MYNNEQLQMNSLRGCGCNEKPIKNLICEDKPKICGDGNNSVLLLLIFFFMCGNNKGNNCGIFRPNLGIQGIDSCTLMLLIAIYITCCK